VPALATIVYLALFVVLILHRRQRVGRDLLYGVGFAAVLVTAALLWERLVGAAPWPR
jgi:uncharacterized membrane protein YwaF